MLCCLPVSNLGEVGALGRPHRCRAKPKNKGGGEEGVELRVELSGDVGGVAEDAHHQSPLHRQLVNHDGGQEHAGEDQGGVHHRVGPDAQAVHWVDRGLQLGHGFKGNEEKKESKGDEKQVLVDSSLLLLNLCARHLVGIWCLAK